MLETRVEGIFYTRPVLYNLERYLIDKMSQKIFGGFPCFSSLPWNSKLQAGNCLCHSNLHLYFKIAGNFEVLIFCAELRELSHLTLDLSQAEKEITVVTSWATDKMTTIFIQNYNLDHFEWNRCHFMHLLSL